MSPISNASRLADFGSGIGTQGAVIQVDNTNQRVGIGTTNPQAMLQVGTAISMFGSTGIVSATEFYGDGSNLDGVVSGVDVQLEGTTVGTSVTVLNFGAGISSVTPVSSGISTIETSRILTIGVRTGAAVTFAITGTSFNVSARSGNVSIDV